MDNPEKLATLRIQDALKYICVHAETCFEVFMYMQSNENHPTVDMVRFTPNCGYGPFHAHFMGYAHY